MKPPVLVTEPPVAVSTTSTAPAAFAGVVAVQVVDELHETPVAAVPPNVTLLVPERSVPVIVTVVPPATGPELGAMLVIVGAAT